LDAAEGSMHSKCTINFLNEWKNSNKQSNIEREKQIWKNQTPWLQTILQSYSNQNNMIIRAFLQVLTDHAAKTWLHLLPDLKVTCLWLSFPNQARSSWSDLSLIDLSHHQGPHPPWDVAAAQQIVDQNLTKLKASVHCLCFFIPCSPANSSVLFFKFNFFKKVYWSIVDLQYAVLCSVVSDSLQPPWTAARQASLSFTISWSFQKLMSIELVVPSNHLILCRPLLLPSVFPSIRVFSNESALRIRWSKY